VKDWIRETSMMRESHVDRQCSPKTTPLSQWKLEGERRFGDDRNRWRFICPACGEVQTRADFLCLGMNQRQVDQITSYSCIRRWRDQSCKHIGGPVNLLISPGEIRHTFDFAP